MISGGGVLRVFYKDKVKKNIALGERYRLIIIIIMKLTIHGVH